MRRFVSVIGTISLFACAAEGPQLPAAGEACDEQGQCAAGLDCMHLVCVDDRGPQIVVQLPEQLTVVPNDATSLATAVSVTDVVDGDQLELIVDPTAAAPQRELIAIDGNSANAELTLPAPLAPGSHHLRARIVDADGQPYPNPSASAEVVLFVRDPDIADTPQIAVVWPPSGHQHEIGNPLEIEIAVLYDSFTFVTSGADCKPLPDCEPELGPACEAECGPVSRLGHAKVFMLPDYPACLFDQPINCNGLYIASLRPDDAELLGDGRVRAVIPAERLLEPGSTPMQVALSYVDHDAYPSKANVIYDEIMLELIE